MTYWIIAAVVAAAVFTVRFRPGGKWREMLKGHDHCQACRAWLKWSEGGYATVCPRCGQEQTR